jgi:hypothetical protein
MRRGLDLKLHQVEEVRAAGDEFRTLRARGRGRSLAR